MKKLIVGLVVAVLCVGLAGAAMAANIASHQVTVQVNAINEIAIVGANITLTINSATAGQEPNDAGNDYTCDLLWTTNESSKKITVETDLGSPTYTLKVVAQNVTGGTAAAEVTLSTTGTNDFISGISQTIGSCDLKYTASATASQETGSETHTITYTLTAG